MSKNFVDRLRIFVKAGSGAAGNPAIRGRGGDGGSVYLEAREDCTLENVLTSNPTKRFKATHGMEASKRRGVLLGRNGTDLVIPVPTGITVFNGGQSNAQTTNTKGDTNFTPVKLGDLDTPGQRLLVAQGGMGGIAQTGFLGAPGQAHAIVLDLKLMADYSLLGFPNAGKSSLLRAVSNANVKIASYPFTTVRPQMANCKYDDARRISLVDLPGLADIYASYPEAISPSTTSSSSTAPSHEVTSPSTLTLPPLRHTHFLKHVERSSCLLLLLDSLGFQRDQRSPWRSPLACAYLIVHLLERWSGGFLLEKPFVCLLNKIDLPGAMDEAHKAHKWLERFGTQKAREASCLPAELLPRRVPHFHGIHFISASEGTNIPDLKIVLRKYLDEIELMKRGESLQLKCKEENAKDVASLFDRSTNFC